MARSQARPARCCLPRPRLGRLRLGRSAAHPPPLAVPMLVPVLVPVVVVLLLVLLLLLLLLAAVLAAVVAGGRRAPCAGARACRSS